MMLGLVFLLTVLSVFVPSAAAVTPQFTAQQGDSNANYVTLNWSEVVGNEFAVAKQDGSNQYETIPLKSTIKVLSVYPDLGNNLSTWMGTVITGGTIGSPQVDGRQYNMEITSMGITEFNSGSGAALGSVGNWNYDVVYFGAYDANNSKDLNSASKAQLDKFIAANRGVLLGHDTVAFNHTYFISIGSTYLGMFAHGEDVTARSSPSTYIPTYGSTTVKVVKKVF